MPSNLHHFGIASKRIVTEGGERAGAVLVSDGVITAVCEANAVPAGLPVEDVGDLAVMAGLIDCHVHVNEPGRTEWEGFETATRAAAAGGITSIADMPLNSTPVTTTLEAFQEKLTATSNRLWVDCAFWGGVVPGNTDELEDLVKAGVSGFKCFLIHSGINDFPNVRLEDLHAAMPVLSRLHSPLLVHAELENGGELSPGTGDCRDYRTYLASRPRRWENSAIELMADLCGRYKTAVHIVHLSSSEALPVIARAKAAGLPFTAETCPHYLTLAAEEIRPGDTRFKCAPPIREKENCHHLWSALSDGLIDFVVSDHSPCLPELKLLSEGDFMRAWGGVSSLQLGLPLVWTEARRRGHSLADLTRWLSRNTARLLALDGRKGALAPGYDADIVVWDPEAEFAVTAEIIHHRHKLTPYEGRRLNGVVHKTYVRGRLVYDGGRFPAGPTGQPLLAGRQK